MLGSGKSYYTLGIYPILFAFGAYFVDRYSGRYRLPLVAYLFVHIVISWYISLSFDGIPLYGFDKVAREDGYRWEDGVYHDVPQDMADMIGWNEIGQGVVNAYLELDPSQRSSCNIYCENYGQAGSVMFHGKKIGVPQPISFNGSFVFWSPDSITGTHVIWVHSGLNKDFDPESELAEYFTNISLKHIVNNRYFREDGTRIYLCQGPREKLLLAYRKRIKEEKDRYRRK
jgi:hypothetical protein